MANVSFGGHSKFSALSSDRDRIRKFYCDVLGCNMTKKSNQVDYFKMGNDCFIAALYEDTVLSDSDLLKSIWLEIKARNADDMKRKILAFGVKEIETWDKAHLYFQAPGGQVFRLVGDGEDLSRFEG